MTILKTSGLCSLVAGTAILAGCGSTSAGTASLAPSSIAQAGAAGSVTASASTATADFSDERPSALGGRSSNHGKAPDTAGPGAREDKRPNGRNPNGASSDDDSADDDTSSNDGRSSRVPPHAPSTVTPPGLLPAVAMAGVEIEGSVMGTDPARTTLLVNGFTVVVPETAVIRHGNTAIPFLLIAVGDRVHIKAGQPEAAGEPLVAREVNVQRRVKAADDGDDDDSDDTDDDSSDDDPASAPAA